MEAIDLLRAFHLNILEVMLTIIPIFYLGYKVGNRKVKKLTEEMYTVQKHVLDLNEELLYSKSETPVIGIKHESLKVTNIAK